MNVQSLNQTTKAQTSQTLSLSAPLNDPSADLTTLKTKLNEGTDSNASHEDGYAKAKSKHL